MWVYECRADQKRQEGKSRISDRSIHFLVIFGFHVTFERSFLGNQGIGEITREHLNIL